MKWMADKYITLAVKYRQAIHMGKAYMHMLKKQ